MIINWKKEDSGSSYDEGYTDGIAYQKSLLTDIVVTENGEYNTENGYKNVIVDVPIPEPVIYDGTAKFDGKSYFVLNATREKDTTVIMRGVKFAPFTDNVFGTRSAGSSNCLTVLFNSGARAVRFGIGNREGPSYFYGYLPTLDDYYDFSFSLNSNNAKIWDSEGNLIYDKTASTTKGSSAALLAVGTYLTAGAPSPQDEYFRGEITSIEVYYGTPLVHNYVFRNVDGVGKIYDTISDKYFDNLGSGNITINSKIL